MATQRRQRRSSEEIRRRLVDAARELFEQKGYDATTTRDICNRAGVAQQQLFHNFGSKEGIFDAAFVPPLAELVSRYVGAWGTTREDSSIEERIAFLIEGLFDLASENRAVLLSAVSRATLNRASDSPPSGLLDHIARTLREMEAIEDYPAGIDNRAAIIATAGMVFGTVMLEEMLYPAGEARLDRTRLVDEMVGLIAHGSVERTQVSPRKR